MGTWGHGSFDNDEALDLLDELVAEKTWYPVFNAINSVIEAVDGPIEVQSAVRALAAAEIFIAALGRPASKLPDEVAAWLSTSKAPKSAWLEDVRKVVARVAQESELKQLWDETPDSALWHREVRDLSKRLGRKIG